MNIDKLIYKFYIIISYLTCLRPIEDEVVDEHRDIASGTFGIRGLSLAEGSLIETTAGGV